MASDTTHSPQQWSEDDSESFLEYSEIIVPGRTEQIATLLHLIPARMEEVFIIVELAAGSGSLARLILERFPFCRYLALDGSAVMREQMNLALAAFSNRLEVQPFELAGQEWRSGLPTPLRCVLCSLSVHHLTDEGKRRLFTDIAERLEPGGALLLADIIKPTSPHVAELYARQYDDIVRDQSLAIGGNLRGYQQFQKLKWNYFTYDYGAPDPYDQPALLSDQLRWLREVGFTLVDCFWIRAGHAVFGGYK